MSVLIAKINLDEGITLRIPIPSIAIAKQGFWLNTDYEYTTGSDNRIWVPPHRIFYVQKDKESNG